MRHVGLSAVFFIGAVAFPAVALAQVIINEILFDPVGSDTGLEWVELYNPSSDSVSLAGWELYPDGIGYYTFQQGIEIAGNSFLTIYLRQSGADSSSAVYDAAATGNIGNSSGSLALFSGEPRGKDTIKAFLRYHKPSSTERKTWESAAADAGLWTAGSFIDVSNLSEGSSIGWRSNCASFTDLNAWTIFTSPSLGAPNSAGGSSPISADPQETASSTAAAAQTFVMLPEIPHLAVSIRAATDGVIGAPHRFLASVATKTGKAVSGELRYIWNFGDGVVSEGPAVTHIFSFPNLYRVSLDVASGPAIGLAIADVKVFENTVMITETQFGDGGFLELWNGGAAEIDVTGWMIQDNTGQSFTFPSGTRIASKRMFVLSNKVTGILKTKPVRVELRYSNLTVADTAPVFTNDPNLATAKIGGSWQITPPSPGVYKPMKESDSVSLVSSKQVIVVAPASAATTSQLPNRALPSPVEVIDNAKGESTSSQLAGIGGTSGRSAPSFIFLAIAAMIVAIGGGGAAVFLRRSST